MSIAKMSGEARLSLTIKEADGARKGGDRRKRGCRNNSSCPVCGSLWLRLRVQIEASMSPKRSLGGELTTAIIAVLGELGRHMSVEPQQPGGMDRIVKTRDEEMLQK